MDIPRELTQWLHDARDGCPEAWNNLLSFCGSYLLDLGGYPIQRDWQAKEDREDLAQITLLQFYRSFHRLRDLTADEALAFLRTIRERTWKNCQRRYGTAKRKARREKASMDVAADDDALRNLAAAVLTPYEAAVGCEEKQRLRDAVARLREKDRRLMVWHYWQEMTFDEIGRRLGCTAKAAQLRHIRILERLRRELKRLA